ncbi:hypothetical protein [Thalassomonas sp. RHCl1]|uniref:hypothetical protein n=1 Tax=Thalassomonas sp. RHCl1 TaxID=2995320 RepID=UPI00248B6750|nr:hypothetical protein [Thalassomonas sp. RHCl1]
MEKVLLPIIGLLSSAMWASPSSAASNTYYETRICGDCSYSEALAIAKKLEPQKDCTLNSNAGPEQQSCYSSTNKILVINSVTRAIYGFYNGHDNQGMSDMDLVTFVRDMESIPEKVIYLANGILDADEALHQVAEQLTEEINSSQNSYTASASKFKNQVGIQSDDNNNQCDNSREVQAVKAATSVSIKSAIEIRANEILEANPSLESDFKSTTITGLNVGVSKDGFTLGGSWVVGPKSKYVYNRFEGNTDVPIGDSQSEQTQVVYTLSSNKHGISLELNPIKTVFAGLTLNQLKQGVTQPSEITKCLGEALDKAIPKTVVLSGSGSGSGGSGSTGGSLNPRFGNIPVTGDTGNFGGGGGSQTCDHHYYHNGELIATIAGPCP